MSVSVNSIETFATMCQQLYNDKDSKQLEQGVRDLLHPKAKLIDKDGKIKGKEEVVKHLLNKFKLSVYNQVDIEESMFDKNNQSLSTRMRAASLDGQKVEINQKFKFKMKKGKVRSLEFDVSVTSCFKPSAVEEAYLENSDKNEGLDKISSLLKENATLFLEVENKRITGRDAIIKKLADLKFNPYKFNITSYKKYHIVNDTARAQIQIRAEDKDGITYRLDENTGVKVEDGKIAELSMTFIASRRVERKDSANIYLGKGPS